MVYLSLTVLAAAAERSVEPGLFEWLVFTSLIGGLFYLLVWMLWRR